MLTSPKSLDNSPIEDNSFFPSYKNYKLLKETQSTNPAIVSFYKNKLLIELSKLDNLKTWLDNWNGYGAIKPDIETIERAKILLHKLYASNYEYQENWIEPNITAESDGGVLFEWWFEKRKLSITVSPADITYIKVPSAEMEQMVEGVIELKNISIQYSDLFQWLKNT